MGLVVGDNLFVPVRNRAYNAGNYVYAEMSKTFKLAEELGAKVVKLKFRGVADALIEFAKREGITHVVFGQTSKSRLDTFLHGSIINRFLAEVRDSTVQVVPVARNSEVLMEK